MDAPSGTFEIFRGVVIQPGRYWWSRYELQYFMNPGRPLSFGAFVNWGQFYGGHSTDFELTAAGGGGGPPLLGPQLATTTAQLPGGGFSGALFAQRVGEGLHNPPS